MGIGDFLFGNSGYRPDKKTMKQSQENLTGATAPRGYLDTPATYTRNGKTISEKDYNQYKGTIYEGDLGKTEGVSQFRQDKPEFSYQPGESGYQTQGYNQFQYSPRTLEQKTSPYYQGIENRAIEQAKGGITGGMEQAGRLLGSRGLGQGGTAKQTLGNLALQGGEQLGRISADVGMQRARDLSDLEKTQQMMDFNREQAQAGEGQFGATHDLKNLISQYEMDKGSRAEKYGYWKDPYQDAMELYLGQLGAAGQNTPGLIGQIGSGIKGASDIATSWI